MSSGKAISIDDAKQKLRNLGSHIPDLTEDVARLVLPFATVLADHLNSRIVPQGFVIACEMLRHGAEHGINPWTSQPICGDLVGYPLQMYSLLRGEFSGIAKAVFPKDFAQEVADIIEAINQQMTEEEN